MQPETLSLPLVDRPADATATQPDRATKRVTPGSKTARLLRTFLQRGEYGLSCFEAVPMAHDYVLRTSVSNLRRQFGFTFHRKWETVPALGGTATADCVRYWFTEEDEALARELLGEAEEGAAA